MTHNIYIFAFFKKDTQGKQLKKRLIKIGFQNIGAPLIGLYELIKFDKEFLQVRLDDLSIYIKKSLD